jgi:hypothetical protein
MFAGAAVAGAGQLCLLAVSPASGYLALLRALLGVGTGLGLFSAPVVGAAIRAVPPELSGLAGGGAGDSHRHQGSKPGSFRIKILFLFFSGAETRHFSGLVQSQLPREGVKHV